MIQNQQLQKNMIIQLTEPINSRYIYINPVSSKVHLLVPIKGGREISTDNTCERNAAVKKFFSEIPGVLNAYKDALEVDILILNEDSHEVAFKKWRLIQIKYYIDAIAAMQDAYAEPVSSLLKKKSNLYSFQLRPTKQDPHSYVENPVFTIDRRDDNGQPSSLLYHEMMKQFKELGLMTLDPKVKLKEQVLSQLLSPELYATSQDLFEDIQRILSIESLNILGVTIDFTIMANGTPVIKKNIDELISDENLTPKEYIDTLLNACVSRKGVSNHFFYGIAEEDEEIKVERLSILTQFYLANFNVHCKIKGISDKNFGVVLDNSPDLSKDLVDRVSKVLTEGCDIGKVLYEFINTNKELFNLKTLLDEQDLDSVQKKFTRTFHSVTGTDDNPHMDEFMILDLESSNNKALFVAHQGAICVNFAEIISPSAAERNKQFFEHIRKDFEKHLVEIPNTNDCIQVNEDLDPDTLLSQMTTLQIENLPPKFKELCCRSPNFELFLFLNCVARKTEDDASKLLKNSPNVQELLKKSGIIEDYSGREFNCTAFEYAYWAGNIAMCSILFQYMEEETKRVLLTRLKEINKNGLPFKQHNLEQRSTHFDLSIIAKQINDYLIKSNLFENKQSDAQKRADWLKIGMTQRDIPAYAVRNIYGANNERRTSSTITFFNRVNQREETWYPLAQGSGLGFSFSLFNAKLGMRSSDRPILYGDPEWPLLEKTRLMFISLEQEVSESRKLILNALGDVEDRQAEHQEKLPSSVNSLAESGFGLDEDSESGFELDSVIPSNTFGHSVKLVK